MKIVVVDPRQVALRLDGTATIATGHPLTEDAAGAFVGDLNERLNAALGKMLDASFARTRIPPLPGLDVAIDTLEDEPPPTPATWFSSFLAGVAMTEVEIQPGWLAEVIPGGKGVQPGGEQQDLTHRALLPARCAARH